MNRGRGAPAWQPVRPAPEDGDLALRLAATSARRVLDPVERSSEIIFGLIMVVTFTGSLSVTRSGQDDVRAMLGAALGCNVAWGLVDGVMYVVTSLVQRSRAAAIGRGLHALAPARARALLLDVLPGGLGQVVDEAAADRIVSRVRALPPPAPVRLERDDLLGGLWSALLTVAATLPPTLPFLLLDDVAQALRLSHLVAMACLFLAGFELGHATGVGRWRLGFTMVLVGAALAVATIALGG